MNQLSPQASRQAEDDAKAKRAVQSGQPQAALGWFRRQGWKVKFFLAAVLMFLLYGAVSTGLRLTGLGSYEDSPSSCDSTMPLEKRAACIVAKQDAAKARSEAEREKQKGDDAAQIALANEVRRQRAIVTAQPLKEAFDQRLMEIVTANPPITDFAKKSDLHKELRYMLFQYLHAGDHPLNELRGPWDKSSMEQARRTEAGRRDPPRWREAKTALDQACAPPVTFQSRIACAEATKVWIDKLAFEDTDRYILQLAIENPIR